jgi:signal transduction histidine kinase
MKKFLGIPILNSKRLEILNFTRIASGSVSLIKEKFNLKKLIRYILKEYEQKIQNKKNIKLFFQSHENDDIIIEADRTRFSKSFITC